MSNGKMKFINFKFILTATLTFIPYTALWFLWHNNIFPNIYYSISSVYSISAQNIWAMNFANALLVYGFVYFYFRSVKPDTNKIMPVMWGIYYNISVTGFFSFMAIGIMKDWNLNALIYDMIWSVIGGILMGILVSYLYPKIVK